MGEGSTTICNVHVGEQAGQSVEQTWHREAQDFGPVDAQAYSEHVRFLSVKVSATSLHVSLASWHLSAESRTIPRMYFAAISQFSSTFSRFHPGQQA
jgi:hypothetical protein